MTEWLALKGKIVNMDGKDIINSRDTFYSKIGKNYTINSLEIIHIQIMG